MRIQIKWMFLLLLGALAGCSAPARMLSRPDPDGGLEAHEAPMLSRQVRAGKLPPLEQRLPSDPLVVKPWESPGYYGGEWHMMVDDPSLNVYKMIGGYAPLVRWKADCSGLEPGIALSYEYNKEGNELTIHLRHGVKWSDGVEFTSEDLAYWAQLIHEGKQLIQTPYWTLVHGKEMQYAAPDKYTFVMKFAGPNWYVPLNLATGFWESENYSMPKHYLKQFDPHFNPAYKDYTVFDKMNRTHANPDRPTLCPWKLVAIENSGFRMVLERNPFYYAVDTKGRQLPYIDRIICTYVPNEQVRVLKVLSGEIDAQFRMLDLHDYGLYMQGAKRGDYRVLRWALGNGASDAFLLNWSTPDPVLRGLIRDFRFRKALSLGIDRDKCNLVAWRGMGTPQQATISKQAWHFNTPEGRRVFDTWAHSYAAYDLPRANQYLDEMGLTRRDPQGYRLRPDGQRLSLLVDMPPQSISGPETDEALIVKDGWEKLGIEVNLHNWPDAELGLRRSLGKYVVDTGGESEMDLFTYPDWVFPTSDNNWHPLVGKWYKTGGKEGEAPTGSMKTLLDIYEKIKNTKDINVAHKLALEAIRLHINEGLFCLGTVADLPELVIARNNFRNVPNVPRILGPWAVAGPATSYPETFFFAPPEWKPDKKTSDSPLKTVQASPQITTQESEVLPMALVVGKNR